MIRIIIPIVLLVLGLGGGIVVGRIFASGMEPGADIKDITHMKAPTDTHGETLGDVEYVRLNNQFLVPVMRHGSVRSLVVLSLTLEVRSGQSLTVFQHEPRLRDAFLRVMFAHANSGGFDGNFTSASAMMPLREGLREAAAEVLGDITADVLIVDIVRQDM